MRATNESHSGFQRFAIDSADRWARGAFVVAGLPGRYAAHARLAKAMDEHSHQAHDVGLQGTITGEQR